MKKLSDSKRKDRAIKPLKQIKSLDRLDAGQNGMKNQDDKFKPPQATGQPQKAGTKANQKLIATNTTSELSEIKLTDQSNATTVTQPRQLLKEENAALESPKTSKAASNKNEKIVEGYSLSTSPQLTKQIAQKPISTYGLTQPTQTAAMHTTIPAFQTFTNTYNKAYGADATAPAGDSSKPGTETPSPLVAPKLKTDPRTKKTTSLLKKTTTLLQELENMQGHPTKPLDQNEVDLGLVPIDIYTTSEYETAEQIVEARGYVLQEVLGSGAFANVYKAWHIAEQMYTACKVIEIKRKKRKRLNDVKHELYVLDKMDHQNIVKLYEHFLIDEKVYIFLEFTSCGTLSDYVRKRGPLRETRCRKWFKQISSGMYHMHSQGISHRDLSGLGNILIDEYRNLKITDFGLSRVSYRKGYGVFYCTSYAGTEPYMAVEIMKKNENGKRIYDPLAADIWAMGVCLYAMANKAYPFNPEDKELMVSNQLSKKWKFTKKQRGKLSHEMRDLLKHLLEPNPKKRITFLGIATHPWMQMTNESEIQKLNDTPHPSVSTTTTTTNESNVNLLTAQKA